MKTIEELDAYWRKHLKIDDKVTCINSYCGKTDLENKIYGIVQAITYMYHDKISCMVGPRWKPNVQKGIFEPDFEDLVYYDTPYEWNKEVTRETFMKSVKGLKEK